MKAPTSSAASPTISSVRSSTRLPTKDGARTQALSRRWHPLWRAAPLNLEAAVEHRSEENHVAAIAGALRAHGGRVRRVSLAWRGYCHRFPELDCVLRSPMLVNLHEFDLLHAPWQPWVETHSQRIPHSVLSSSSTLRVLRIWSNSSEKLQFPMESARTLSFPCLKQLTLSDVNLSESTLHGPCLEQLTLSSVNLSESTFHDLLSGSPVLVSLVLAGNTGLGSRLHIRSLGVSASWEFWQKERQKIIITDVPHLERLVPLSTHCHEQLRVIHAPKLKALGYLSSEMPMLQLGNMVFKKLVPVSLSSVASTVKILALATRPNLDLVIRFLKCFPSVEKLYIKFYLGYTKNVRRYASLKCLDLHLKMVHLIRYQNNVAYASFVKFFVLNARVLEYMKFAVARGECDAKWISYQHNELRLSDRASQCARFDFEADYLDSRGSVCIQAINDLATDDPFGR